MLSGNSSLSRTTPTPQRGECRPRSGDYPMVWGWRGVSGQREICGLHGERIAYREAGRGEAVVLLHGMAGSSDTWQPVISQLGERYRVIAPGLLGHGHSTKPRTDYSLGAFAAGLRDLFGELGISRATIVGHSLGRGRHAVPLPASRVLPATDPGQQRRTRAKGMIMERYRVNAVQAFELLKQLSQRSNNRLVEIAQGLIDAEFQRTNTPTG